MDHFYLTKEFARQSRRGGLTDDGLREALSRAEAGKVDADFGSGIVKQRVARPNEGRSGGFRTNIAYRRGDRAIFLHVFAKSKKATLTPLELETYQGLAAEYDKLTEAQLDALVDQRGWRRVERD